MENEKEGLINILSLSNNVVSILTGVNGSGKTYVLEQLDKKIEDYVYTYPAQFEYVSADSPLRYAHVIEGEEYIFRKEYIKRCVDIMLSLFPNIKFEFKDEKTQRYPFVFHHYNYITYRIWEILYDLVRWQSSYFIIENLENGLHPSVQTKLMDIIIRLAIENDNKIFIETHSDHIINAARVDVKEELLRENEVAIYNFELVKGMTKLTAIEIDRSGELSDYPKDFLEECVNQLSKLL